MKRFLLACLILGVVAVDADACLLRRVQSHRRVCAAVAKPAVLHSGHATASPKPLREVKRLTAVCLDGTEVTGTYIVDGKPTVNGFPPPVWGWKFEGVLGNSEVAKRIRGMRACYVFETDDGWRFVEMARTPEAKG